ncbi:Exonuclease V subunit beta [Ceratobasidium theobromae]|uniref:Exonuclease V subunit beta n=1 Tax=Ceratobasidium theobromae TaxID=1582974 RepID=A0A5N5QG55_9AGAM|nr:Exonuclease V subunit beta [Ceratobasidium theobromae]
MATTEMTIEPETPNLQYTKREYMIRLVGRIPRRARTVPDEAKDGKPKHPLKFKLQGTVLSAVDATMPHVAAMYALGRLLDSIREPFNASVIRAEMNALRSRYEIDTPLEYYEMWKKETDAMKDIDPLVKELAYDVASTRNLIPRCPYLSQLIFKSFSIGNRPVHWPREREDSLGRNPENNVRGRSGTDIFCMSIQLLRKERHFSTLQPRYAFIEDRDIIRCTSARRNSNRSNKPLRIFNAREHAYRFMIPESESFPDSKRFGEQPWTRHLRGARQSLTERWVPITPTQELKSDPEYMALDESRMKRAREHPAVVRLRDFGWLRVEDVIKPDGSALLQDIWRYTYDHDIGDYYHREVVEILAKDPRGIVVERSEALDDEIDHPAPLEVEYSFFRLQELPLVSTPSLRWASFRALGKVTGKTQGILSFLDRMDGNITFLALKTRLAQILWEHSSLGGTGLYDAAYRWLQRKYSNPQSKPDDDYDSNLAYDYDSTESSLGASEDDEWIWWIILYQGLCYRDSVAKERKRRNASKEPADRLTDFIIMPELNDFYGKGEFPGHAMGDVAHPAFDISHFVRVREHVILRALKIWAEQIWLPDLDSQDWDLPVGNRTSVPLRTLNVSGCQFVTRNTIRKALEIAPTIRRIIMIGCPSFSNVDLMVLSLDGTLNHVDCILTSESIRGPFENPEEKKSRSEEAYNQAMQLVPQAPDVKTQAALDSVPGVFFNSFKDFKFKYSDSVMKAYFHDGGYLRAPSHTFALPPSLTFDAETHRAVCGPPRFSVVLATYALHSVPVTGAGFPHVPIDTGLNGIGTSGSGLSSIWRGIIDLLEFLGNPYLRNVQRWNAINWSMVVKCCFSGPGKKWGEKSGLEGGGEFYGFPAYFKGGFGQANEEWIFAYQFRDVIARIQTCWANSMTTFVYPESSSQDCWAFIRYGRDANPLSHEIPTLVLYTVREFRQAVCPDIPILEDEAMWINRAEDVLKNGTWHRSYPIVNWETDREMARKEDPDWEHLRVAADRLTKPKFMKEVPHELMLLVERMAACQMNQGADVF